MHAIGVDIGGTKIAAGVVDEQGKILAQTRIATEAGNPASIDKSIAHVCAELVEQFEVEAIGLAAAGLCSPDRRDVLFAPNIDWRDYPIADNVRRLMNTEIPIVVENDANAAGWAEFQFGVAQDTSNMLMLTIGTGLGGALVSNGQLVRGNYGVGGEVGHMRLVPNGRTCGCGHDGCWEQYAAGNALVRNAKSAAIKNPAAARGLLDRVEGNAQLINGPLVTQAAQEGDALAISLLAELGRWIGEGAATAAGLVDPEIIVIGGGVAAAGDLLLEPTREAYLEVLPARGYRPEARFALADMGNEAGLVGAADLARQ
ncbi:ROK family glucokinase [Timonella sp. A28]|uniref:ROK family glucokinase n=1 Tax=Timonella sp. A28 TaxID=3442640 RepID=UPI003EB6C645